MIILAGDVCGTSTRLQLIEFAENGKGNALKNSRYSSGDYSHFNDILDDFFTDIDIKVDRACFGVAGPIINQEVRLTNLTWGIKASDVKSKLGLDKVFLLNDFVAIGYGLETLLPKDLVTLQIGKPKEGGVKSYTGAGTGLGVGFMTYTNGMYKVHPTEGGHIGFAPTDEEQDELLKFLRKKYRRVSIERLVSGHGLTNIYGFVCSRNNTSQKENLLTGNEQGDVDIAALITEHAIEHQDPLARHALDIFIRIYGAVVGNLALTTLPFGGLYVVGGIAPKLLAQIKEGAFLEYFHDKGRMSNLLKDVPLHVVLCTEVGVRGAALYASCLKMQDL